MSAYRNLYSDLPARISQVWKSTQLSTSEGKTFDVTAMLVAGAAGLAMPLELLKDLGSGNRKDWNAHPGFEHAQQDNYKLSLEKCDTYLRQKVSALCRPEEVTFQRCSDISGIIRAAEYPSQEDLIPLDTVTVRIFVKILRNALAHSSIAALSDAQREIRSLVFFSEIRDTTDCRKIAGYDVICMTVQAYSSFLSDWFALLQEPYSFMPAVVAMEAS